jgi:hypothetical protein
MLNAPNITVSLADIEPLRLPSELGMSYPTACRSTLANLENGWRQDDEKQFDELTKRMCSYRLGWVEKVPGTCHAGGPPPLCPANHWINIGPANAAQRMKEQEAPVRDSREQQLIKAACQCKRDQLEAAATNATPVPNDQVFNGYAPSPYDVPCTYGCPIGTSCRGNVCRPNTALESNASKAGQKAIDQGSSYVQGKVQSAAAKALIGSMESSTIKQALSEAIVLSETFAGKTALGVFSGIFQPTMMSTDRDLYDHQAQIAAADLRQSQELYRELADAMAGRPARAPKMIQSDLEQVKSKLRDDLGNLNTAYSGLVTSRSIQAGECPEVLEFQQQRINQSITDVVALP